VVARKILEPRPRSLSWVGRLERAGYARLVYGPHFGAPTVFAAARIDGVTLRPFESVTDEELPYIGSFWRGRPRQGLIEEYTRWFGKDLAKGYPVAWVRFAVVDG